MLLARAGIAARDDGADDAPEEIAARCRIVTAARPGFDPCDLPELQRLLDENLFDQLRSDVLHTPGIEISASDIRRRTASGRSIRYLVPDAVADYISRHNLYAGS